MPLSPTPQALPNDLSYITATALVDDIPPALNFIDQMLFPRSTEQTLVTEDFEIITVSDDRSMAPFIKPGTRAPAAQGISYSIGTYRTPMIAEARPMPVAELLLMRRPGTNFYAQRAEMTAATREHIAREFERLARRRENRMEWMAAEILKKSLSYTSDAGGKESFTIAYPFHADTVFTLAAGVRWDAIDYTSELTIATTTVTTDPSLAFTQAGRVMNVHARVSPTIALMGTDAAQAFVNHPMVMKKLDNLNYKVDALDLTQQFQVSGARYLGRYMGVPCWEYGAQLTLDSGSAGPLIDADEVFWIHTGPMAQFQKVFGVIPNWKLSLGNRKPVSMAQISQIAAVPARVFADVIADEHGNVLEGAVYSRPLPVLRRPNVIVRGTVTS